jgi:two-component system KDP operon response regulator KdpE
MMAPRRCALVADADPGIGRLLGRDLPAQGFSVTLGKSGAAVLSQAISAPPDTVIIGSDMPDVPALDLVRAVHRQAGLPVLALLNDARGAAVVEALDAGADDCIGKPFLVKELAARLRKLVRRALTHRGLPITVRSGALEIDCVRWRVLLSGDEVALSTREHTILRLLVEAGGKVVSTREMLLRLWGTDQLDQARRVRQVVRRLRGKLGMTLESAVRIQAEPQKGYRLQMQPTRRSANTGEEVPG